MSSLVRLQTFGDSSAADSAQDSEVIRPLDTPAFLRLFQLRAAQIMWFLGAGASRSAGIKTAGDMIWDFKQRQYLVHCAQSSAYWIFRLFNAPGIFLWLIPGGVQTNSNERSLLQMAQSCG